MMKTIAILDSKNYDPDEPRILRKAVRAVIVRKGKVALVKSLKKRFYKFLAVVKIFLINLHRVILSEALPYSVVGGRPD